MPHSVHLGGCYRSVCLDATLMQHALLPTNLKGGIRLLCGCLPALHTYRYLLYYAILLSLPVRINALAVQVHDCAIILFQLSVHLT